MTALVRTTIRCLPVLALATSAAATEIEVTRLDGSTARGRVVNVVPQLVLKTSAGRTELAWPQVLSIRTSGTRAPTSAPAEALPFRFELADGSAFSGRVEAATESDFVVRFRQGQSCRLTPSAVRAIVARTAEPAAQRQIEAARKSADESADRAIVARKDDAVVLRGTVRRIEIQHVLFTWNDRDVPLPWSRLAALILARPVPRSASCVVTLHDGELFAGRIIAGDDSTLTLQSAVFDNLALRWTAIERIDCRSERLVFLSDLEPARYEFEPLLGKQWDYARDKTLSGRPIRLGGRRYDKGITLHSRAALAYHIGGAFRRFVATVGIVDEMEDRGCVTLRVIGDGEVLWEASGVRGGQPPRELAVDIGGVAELVLVVDYDEDLDLSDHACWAFARLIR